MFSIMHHLHLFKIEAQVKSNLKIRQTTRSSLQWKAVVVQEFEGDQFRHLVHALCPAIYGHELIKAGILLSLFGGVRKNVGSANRIPTRGDIHVLICGDPGLGKSQMLQAIFSPPYVLHISRTELATV